MYSEGLVLKPWSIQHYGGWRARLQAGKPGLLLRAGWGPPCGTFLCQTSTALMPSCGYSLSAASLQHWHGCPAPALPPCAPPLSLSWGTLWELGI